MKGSVYLDKSQKSPCWVVSWPMNGKRYKIRRYNGNIMYQLHEDKSRDVGFKTANKLLSLIQGDWERHERKEIVFRIEKFTKERYTDVVPYLEEWLEDCRPNLTPGGYIKYRSDVNNYLIPFFRDECPIMLHEIQYDTTIKLMNWVPGSGKQKKNVVDTLKTCMRYALKSKRINTVPLFPEKKLYDIQDNPPVWLPSDRFWKVIECLDPEHRPIIMWLYLHLRRPGEAFALLKEDYDPQEDVFTIRRGVSNGYLIDRTKTGKEHKIPCAAAFKPYMKQLPDISKFFFTCSESKSEGKRYTGKLLRKYWNAACEKAGEDIYLYRGTKTSRASQMINELGMSTHDLQIAGDWASHDSVKHYARANIAKKRELIDRQVIPISARVPGTSGHLPGTFSKNKK